MTKITHSTAANGQWRSHLGCGHIDEVGGRAGLKVRQWIKRQKIKTSCFIDYYGEHEVTQQQIDQRFWFIEQLAEKHSAVCLFETWLLTGHSSEIRRSILKTAVCCLAAFSDLWNKIVSFVCYQPHNENTETHSFDIYVFVCCIKYSKYQVSKLSWVKLRLFDDKMLLWWLASLHSAVVRRRMFHHLYKIDL